ncbi:restriction endonuclease subunit S [Sinimarinibacterium flocculans]|uniref:Type I restriction enzyme S subunit n=1 Tax=Sinimarinibacterium flocculans TaxID=985250 RepID=A0A318E5C6_9GAMM|nr:restriction endonuclease subunit S [Sinimarinibacterium flocculans]PXV65278.1 type I restriction enzyme S subunit [Sinimarinibacterium flocculans]
MKRSQAMALCAKPAPAPKLRFSEFQGGPDWETRALGSLVTISTDKVGDNECVPMSITSGVGLVSQIEKFGRVIAGSSYKNYLLLKKNDFAYNKSATKEYPEGFIALYSGDALAAVPNSIFTAFRISGESPAPSYLNYLFLGNLHGQWLRKFIEVGARAHGSLSIAEDDLLTLPVPLPSGAASIAEQQKIAECLSTLDELIAASRQKLDALKAHKKGLMQQLFPREGETLPRLRFPEFQDAPEWSAVKLGDVCEIQRGRFSHRPRNDPQFFGGKYPFIQTGDVVNANGGAVRASQSLNEKGLSASKLFKPTIVLVTIAANIGDTALLTHEACFTDSVVGLIPSSGISPYFLELAVRGKKEFLNKVAPQNAQKNINNEILRAVEILTPQLAEQQRIASCLSSLDDLIAAQSDQLEALRTHKKGLMQQLFPTTEIA